MTDGLPSASDLDAVAAEERIRQLTSPNLLQIEECLTDEDLLDGSAGHTDALED